MIVVLVGYPGSQKIVKASKYLTSRYLPIYFNVIYLNYTGDVNGWSKYLSTFLSYLQDEYIIFALDDYLLSETIDRSVYMSAESQMERGGVMCVKLCESTEQEHNEYPITTQYCIWRREYLIALLEQVNTPWQFEIIGSKIHKETAGARVVHYPCLKYFTNSSISSRWEGVRLDGLKEEDIQFLKVNNYVE